MRVAALFTSVLVVLSVFGSPALAEGQDREKSPEIVQRLESKGFDTDALDLDQLEQLDSFVTIVNGGIDMIGWLESKKSGALRAEDIDELKKLNSAQNGTLSLMLHSAYKAGCFHDLELCSAFMKSKGVGLIVYGGAHDSGSYEIHVDGGYSYSVTKRRFL